GNSKKKEVSPDGSSDKNVFDIQQGVSIVIAVKKAGSAKGKPLANISHIDFWGERTKKYESLWNNSISTLPWNDLKPSAPQYTFVPRDSERLLVYQSGFGIQELMPVNSVGIVTARDALTIDMNKDNVWERVNDFASLSP